MSFNRASYLSVRAITPRRNRDCLIILLVLLSLILHFLLDNSLKHRHNLDQQLIYQAVNLKAPEMGEERETIGRGGD